MPELPDVEGQRRYVARYAKGRRIERVKVLHDDLVRNRSPQGLGRALKGRRFGAPRRHGKWLVVDIGDAELLLHFGMTGRLRWTSGGAEREQHDGVVFVCDGGELRYVSQRRLGGVWLARDEREREAATGPLGPDAGRVDVDTFTGLLDGRRGAIKAALMDQALLAGVGNLLGDEVLWRARIHGGTPVRELGEERLRALHGALQDTIRRSNRHGRIPPHDGWLTGARDDRPGRCPRCRTELERSTIAGRTSCWCPRCQPPP